MMRKNTFLIRFICVVLNWQLKIIKNKVLFQTPKKKSFYFSMLSLLRVVFWQHCHLTTLFLKCQNRPHAFNHQNNRGRCLAWTSNQQRRLPRKNYFIQIEFFGTKLIAMTSFKTLNTKKYIKQGPVVTPDTLYWKKLSVSAMKHNLLILCGAAFGANSVEIIQDFSNNIIEIVLDS